MPEGAYMVALVQDRVGRANPGAARVPTRVGHHDPKTQGSGPSRRGERLRGGVGEVQYGASEHLELACGDLTPAEVDEAVSPTAVNERASEVEAARDMLHCDFERPACPRRVAGDEIDDLSDPL